MAVTYLATAAGVVLLLGVAGACLFPPTRTNSSKPRLVISLAAVWFGGVLLLTSPWQGSPLDLPLAILMLVAIAGTVWRSTKWPLSIVPDPEGDTLIGSLVFFGLAGLGAHVLNRGPLLHALPLIGVAFAGTMYYQAFCRLWGQDWRIVLPSMRCQGTMANPVFSGGLLVTLLVLSVALRMYWASAIMVPALALSRSRGAYLGALVGGAMLVGWWGVLGAAVVLGSVVAIDPRFTIRDPSSGISRLEYEWRYGRGWLYRQVIRQILQRPWLGYGQNTFRLVAIDTPGKSHRNTHNGLLYYAHAWGIPGVLACLWVIERGLTGVVPMILPALVAYLVWEQFVWPFYGPANIFWLMLGLGMS